MLEGGWLAEEKVRFYVGMNDCNCISPFRADKWTQCSGKRGCSGFYLLLHRGRYGGDDVVGTMRRRLGRIAALLLMLCGEDAVVAE